MVIIRFTTLAAVFPAMLIAGCGGGGSSGDAVTPTPTPASSATPAPTPSATPGPTATPQPTPSPTPAPTGAAAALGGVDSRAVPEIYGIYTATSAATSTRPSTTSQVIIDQSANFIGALFAQSAADPIYVVGKLTGSNYDPVSRFVFFQASGDAYDPTTATRLSFAISDGQLDEEESRVRGLVVALSDGRSVTINSLRRGRVNGTNSGDLTGEFTLVQNPQGGRLGLRMDGQAGTIATPLTIPSDCSFSGALVPNGLTWTTEVSVGGDACLFPGDYLGVVAASLMGNTPCEPLLFRQIALFDESKTRFIMGCLRK